MRRYTITVNDTTKVIDVEATGANVFRVQVDGRYLDVRLDDHRDLAHGPVTPAITVRAAGPAPQVAAPPAGAATAPVGPPAPAAPSSGAAAPARPAAAAGSAKDKLTAPMPGVILSVDVAVGASVQRGQTLMVLEAMKMKNELKAPRDGVVAEIFANAGNQVKYGETLLRFGE